MGMWVTTNLAYGFDFGEDIPSFLWVDEERQGSYSDIANFYSDWISHQLGIQSPAHTNEHNKHEWQAFYDKISEFDKQYPFDFITYCSYNQPKYFLAYKPSVKYGDADTPMAVEIGGIDKEAVDSLFKEFCEKYKVPHQQPEWKILSHYG